MIVLVAVVVLSGRLLKHWRLAILLKLAAITAAMADALRKRGVAAPAASLAAELGSLAR